MTIHRWFAALLPAILALTLAACGGDDDTAAPLEEEPPVTATGETEPAEEPVGTKTEPDVQYISTPQDVVDRMLELADVTADDYVYDLGSGDGRIPITAAQEYGAQGLGIEIQPELIEESRRNAEEAGVAEDVDFRQGDLFELDVSEATVVTLYLLQDLNLQLRPKLLQELDPGSRIVSNTFDMGAWEPEHTETIHSEGREWVIHLWTVPEDVPEELLEDETED